MKVNKETAVAICQDYGFSTADGWVETHWWRYMTEQEAIERAAELNERFNSD